jgi:hypothetical protein
MAVEIGSDAVSVDGIASPELVMAEKAYIRELGVLNAILEVAWKIDNDTIPSPTATQNRGSVFFGKLALHVRSLQSILPQGPKAFPDVASVAVLARAIGETYVSFRYFCVDPKEDQERHFRYALANYHSALKRYEAIKHMVGDAGLVASLEDTRNKMDATLRENQVFQAQPKSEQDKQIAGKKMPHIEPIEIASKAGVDRTVWRSFYITFSQYAHSTPMAIQELYGHRRNDPHTLNTLTVFTGFAYAFLALAACDLLALYGGQKRIAAQDLQVIMVGLSRLKEATKTVQ